MGPEEGIIRCNVCDTENSKFRAKCLDCGSYLSKPPPKRNPRSKQSKGRDKYKRPKQICNGNKNSYQSRGHANRAAKKITQAKGSQMRAYKCEDCKKWHLTKYRS